MKKDVAVALGLYTDACSKGSFGACNNAGLVYQGGVGDGQVDLTKAEEFFKKSCDGKFKNGCFNLSALYLPKKEPSKGDEIEKEVWEKALHYSLLSCDLGHAWGCVNASRIFKLGYGVKADITRAEELKKRAKKLAQQ